MTARSFPSAVNDRLDDNLPIPVFFVRLNIDTDPVYAWTGFGPKSFTSTGDSALDGITFLGIGNIAEIGSLEEKEDGSQSVPLILPGVDLNDDVLKQIVRDNRTWRRKKGYIWFTTMEPDGTLSGTPTRVKTGRMDVFSVEQDGEEGVVKVDLEAFASHVSEALNSAYSEQVFLIDSTDTSQNFAHALANMVPEIGPRDGQVSGGGAYGGGGGSGGENRGGGAFRSPNASREFV